MSSRNSMLPSEGGYASGYGDGIMPKIPQYIRTSKEVSTAQGSSEAVSNTITRIELGSHRNPTQMPTALNNRRHFPCSDCSVIFKSKNALDNHFYKIHSGRHCKNCNYTYATLAGYKRHMADSTCHGPHQGRHKHPVYPGSPESARQCNFCGRKFASKTVCDRHIRGVHMGMKSHKCRSCGKLFSHKGNMDVHFENNHFLELLRELKAEAKAKAASEQIPLPAVPPTTLCAHGSPLKKGL